MKAAYMHAYMQLVPGMMLAHRTTEMLYFYENNQGCMINCKDVDEIIFLQKVYFVIIKL
jgi:hypothetical protein